MPNDYSLPLKTKHGKIDEVGTIESILHVLFQGDAMTFLHTTQLLNANMMNYRNWAGVRKRLCIVRENIDLQWRPESPLFHYAT